MNLKKRLKRFFEMYGCPDPNSVEGLRLRIKWMREDGTPENNPHLKALIKIADMREKEKENAKN